MSGRKSLCSKETFLALKEGQKYSKSPAAGGRCSECQKSLRFCPHKAPSGIDQGTGTGSPEVDSPVPRRSKRGKGRRVIAPINDGSDTEVESDDESDDEASSVGSRSPTPPASAASGTTTRSAFSMSSAGSFTSQSSGGVRNAVLERNHSNPFYTPHLEGSLSPLSSLSPSPSRSVAPSPPLSSSPSPFFSGSALRNVTMRRVERDTTPTPTRAAEPQILVPETPLTPPTTPPLGSVPLGAQPTLRAIPRAQPLRRHASVVQIASDRLAHNVGRADVQWTFAFRLLMLVLLHFLVKSVANWMHDRKEEDLALVSWAANAGHDAAEGAVRYAAWFVGLVWAFAALLQTATEEAPVRVRGENAGQAC